MHIRIAQCSCGQLGIRCQGDPAKVSLCHCLECQRRTGSVFGIAAFFGSGSVETFGIATTYAREADSGFPVRFSFCPECGGTVYWHPQRMLGLVAVAVGAFADRDFPAPAKSVYLEHRHHWVKF